MTDRSLNVDEMAGHFAYLDLLRESGTTNMYGATPYLQRDQDLSKDEARRVLMAWMRTFNREDPPSVRAARAAQEPLNTD